MNNSILLILAFLGIIALTNKESFENTHSTLKNIYGEPLKPCQIKSDDYSGSWIMEKGKGYCSEKGGGVHQICFNVTKPTQDFSKETGQSDWSKKRVNNNHCMCLGAWSLYKAKNLGTGKELVCDAIPEIALSSNYVNNWNTWNGNELPDQIIKGVDSLVSQCYNKKPNKILKNKYNKLRTSYSSKWNSII